jgi:hypothetical protein
MSWIWLCALALLTAGEVNEVIKEASPLGDSCKSEPSRDEEPAPKPAHATARPDDAVARG